MKVHFLGVRGSTPCAGPNYVTYGGHTSCVMVEADGQLFIFDAGSGIVDASAIGLQHPTKTTHLFFSHTHLDHIMGLPFYIPFWKTDHTVNMYAGHLAPYGGVHGFFARTFVEPLFPVPFTAFPANVVCHDFDAGTAYAFGKVRVDSFSLNHPNGAVGYRLTYVDDQKSRSICYITDHEHNEKANRAGLVDFIKETDLLIYDSTYSDLNYESYKGWGHSTWQEAVRLGAEAGAAKIGIFHHDPANTDSKMAVIEQEVMSVCPNGLVTRQGMVIDLR